MESHISFFGGYTFSLSEMLVLISGGYTFCLLNLYQEDFEKLGVLAFEMETTIASLEEELAAERGEKEEALCRNEGLDSEITALTEKLEHSNVQLEHLQEDVMDLVRLFIQLIIDP